MYRSLLFVFQLIVCVLLLNACYNDENIYPLVNISDNSVSLESSKTYPYLDIYITTIQP